MIHEPRSLQSDVGTGTSRRLTSIGRAAAAGMVAAAVALATTDLAGALADPSGPSLVTSVGTWFIDTFAGPLKEPAVELFGTNDKPALLVGIVAISLAMGAALGLVARSRPRLASGAFAVFGLLGMTAGLTNDLSSRGSVLIASVLGVTTGITALHLLFRTGQTPATDSAATRPVDDPTDPAATRRAFLAWTGAASAFAATATLAARGLRGQSAVDQARSTASLPVPNRPSASATATTATETIGPSTANNPFGIDRLTPYVTPNDRFYTIDTALLTPQVDVRDWELSIVGMVDRPLTLSYEQLLARATTEEAVTLSCVSNEVGGDLVGNANWQGVPLRELLDEAGVRPDATQIVGRSVDGWTAGFPTDAAYDGRVALVAVAMNGEPLPAAHGFPARLVVAGLYGYVSATKWLREIELTTWEAFDGYWIDKGWSKNGPVKTQSRIDVPRRGTTLQAGPTPIAGVAWAPTRGIVRVEVQVDDEPWMQARLGDALSANTWRQWMVEWDATPGEHRLRVRATDGNGETQTEQRSRPDPDGATGWHTIVVRVAE